MFISFFNTGYKKFMTKLYPIGFDRLVPYALSLRPNLLQKGSASKPIIISNAGGAPRAGPWHDIPTTKGRDESRGFLWSGQSPSFRIAPDAY